jgi:hypothetical protein
MRSALMLMNVILVFMIAILRLFVPILMALTAVNVSVALLVMAR